MHASKCTFYLMDVNRNSRSDLGYDLSAYVDGSRGSWVVGRGSWVVGRGSWVVGRGSSRGSRG